MVALQLTIYMYNKYNTKMNKKEIERFIQDYKLECKSGLKLFAFIVGTWVFFGIIMLLIFL